MAFNGILLGVLAVTIFSIVESDSDEKKSISDYINFALIVLALIIDTVALSAIVFRLSSYGITPNRLAVLGVNILIWANLIWIMFSYMRFLQNKSIDSYPRCCYEVFANLRTLGSFRYIYVSNNF